ncbi:hypothetical protein [Paraburkholderia fungorum]|uniref:hypothetical protein n=1 Tax=Paraburkholderia fungorum TaxID=134537 RepID=UPI003D6B6FDB
MSGPLENARHERFCQERAKGKTVDEAYVLAGFKPSRSNAHRLSTNEGVRARIAELLGRAAMRAEITAADIANQLDEDRLFARTHKQSAAAVSATLGKAKVLGLITDKSELRIADDQMEALVLAMGGDVEKLAALKGALEG